MMSRLPEQHLKKFRQILMEKKMMDFDDMALCKFGHFKIVSKISKKVYLETLKTQRFTSNVSFTGLT